MRKNKYLKRKVLAGFLAASLLCGAALQAAPAANAEYADGETIILSAGNASGEKEAPATGDSQSGSAGQSGSADQNGSAGQSSSADRNGSVNESGENVLADTGNAAAGGSRTDEGTQSDEKSEAGDGTQNIRGSGVGKDAQSSEESEAREDSQNGKESEAGEDAQSGEESEAGEGSQNSEESETGEDAQSSEESEAREGSQNSEESETGEDAQSSEESETETDAPGGRLTVAASDGRVTLEISLPDGSSISPELQVRLLTVAERAADVGEAEETGDVWREAMLEAWGAELRSKYGDAAAEEDTDNGTEGDTDTGAEGDTDTGAEGDTDTGAEGDTDTGAEGNTDTGAEGNADADRKISDIRSKIRTFLPYYVAVTDGSGAAYTGALRLAFTLHDDTAACLLAEGGINGKLGRHEQDAFFSMKDTGNAAVTSGADGEAVLFATDAGRAGWYSLLLFDRGEPEDAQHTEQAGRDGIQNETGEAAASETEETTSKAEETIAKTEGETAVPETEGETESAVFETDGETKTAVFEEMEEALRTAGYYALPDNMEIQDGNPAWAPENLRAGRASTHKRKVIFQTAEGEVVKWAYCLEPLKGNPGEDIYDISEAVILNSGTVNLNLAKALYYLYGGPAWGKTANGVNLKTIMTEAGCSSSDNYYAMTHYVLGYIYNNGNESLWNAHPAETGVLNSSGVSLVKTLVKHISALPDPYAKLSREKLTAAYDSAKKVHITQSVTYQTFQGNTASLTLPADVTLVNETAGTSGTGTVKIDGGDTFHFESAPSVSGSRHYTLDCRIPTDFTAFKKSFSGDAQDLGFAYYAEETTLEFAVDWPAQGQMMIKKESAQPEITNGNRLYSLANARFGIYADALCTTAVGTLTTDASGNSQTLTLAPGTYYVREEAAPDGFLLSTEVKTAEVGSGTLATVSFADIPIVRNLVKILQKRVNGSTSLSMENARFTVRFYENASPSGAPLKTWELKTDSTGALMLSDAAKVGGDAFYRDTAGNICLPLGCVTFTETAAPAGCRINTEVITNYITKDGISGSDGVILQEPANFTDEPAFIGVRIRKADSETETEGASGSKSGAQGDASLAGAVFAVISNNDYTVVTKSDRKTTYKKGEEVLRITTGEDGTAQLGAELQAGSYLVREVEAPEGYLLNTATLLEFASMTDNDIVNLTAEPVKDEVIRGGFAVAKWDVELNEEKRTQGDATLEGAKFSLVNRSKHSVFADADADGVRERYEPQEEILQFTVDADGLYTSPDRFLPYGTYALTEIDPPAGYTSEGENISREFTIREDGVCVSLTDETTATKNRVIRGDISIFKFRDTLSSEESTEDVAPLPGVVFEIRLKSSGELVETLVTDEDGYATTMDREMYPHGRLPYGLYEITETEHPAEVQAVQPFEVFVGLDANGNEIDHFHYKGIYKNDRPIEAPITLVKKDAESGKVVPLAGTEFQILNEAKEPLTFVCYYPHREEITNFVTDASGTVNIPEKLPYGTYYVREINAPEGYLRGGDLQFQITEYASWEQPLLIEYSDTSPKGFIRLQKSDDSTGEALAGAVFGVFAKENIVTGDGVLHHAAGALVAAFATDEEGHGTSEALYPGRYYLQELKAPEGFCLDTKRYSADVGYAGQDTPVIYVDMETGNKPTTLELLKTDSDGEAMAGILFEITRLGGDGEADTCANVFTRETFRTDENGRILCQYLLPGIYAIKELETPPGYIPNTAVRYAAVDENGRIFESDAFGHPLDENKAAADTETLHWVNEYITWEFSKVDVNGDEELPGAQMEIIDEAGTVIESWISDGTPHKVSKIAEGNYTLVEKAAPEGYAAALEMPFQVTAMAVIPRTVMIDKQVFVSKQDITSGRELPGAHLIMTDAQGKTVDEWISGDTPHAVSNLRVGESYTLTEIQAPDGYLEAESITFTVENDFEIQTVTMKDERVEEPESGETESEEAESEEKGKPVPSGVLPPKTGLPDSKIKYLMLTLSGVSFAAAAALMIRGRKRRKRKERKNR